MTIEDDLDLMPALDRPPVARAQRPRVRWWDRVSIYLPVLLMGVLALGSYWLLRATPSFQPPPPPAAQSTEPNYFMQGFTVKSFDAQGQLRAEVAGAEARHYPDDNRIEIDQARLRSVGADGEIITARAMRVVTNADNTRFDLRGDAVVVREGGLRADGQDVPRMEFRGEALTIELDPDRVSSNEPVELLRGEDRLTANSLDYRDDERVALLKGRVRTRLAPRIEP